MTHVYDLTLGLPHTNYRGLSEPHLLMQAGHMQWASIASAVGRPLSQLRTSSGKEVYAAFYYIETRVPAHAPLESFGLDDALRFGIALRSFKNITIEGRVVFDHAARLPDAASIEAALADRAGLDVHPRLTFGNIFITPVKGNSVLRVAPPADAPLAGVDALPNDENPYHFTRAAADTGALGLFEDGWVPAGMPFEHRYAIDVDRDTNGAGLVYFAQYVAFMETAERLALAAAAGSPAIPSACATSLRHRRVAYYGNADTADTVTVRVTLFRRGDAPGLVGLRYAVERAEDGRRICLSEAVKAVVPS